MRSLRNNTIDKLLLFFEILYNSRASFDDVSRYILMRFVELYYIPYDHDRQISGDVLDLSRSYFSIGYEKIYQIKLYRKNSRLGRSWFDPNITTRVPDLGRLCTCIYVRIRYDTFITNQYALLRWGMIIMAIIFMIKTEDDHDLRFDTTRLHTLYIFSQTDNIDISQRSKVFAFPMIYPDQHD